MDPLQNIYDCWTVYLLLFLLPPPTIHCSCTLIFPSFSYILCYLCSFVPLHSLLFRFVFYYLCFFHFSTSLNSSLFAIEESRKLFVHLEEVVRTDLFEKKLSVIAIEVTHFLECVIEVRVPAARSVYEIMKIKADIRFKPLEKSIFVRGPIRSWKGRDWTNAADPARVIVRRSILWPLVDCETRIRLYLVAYSETMSIGMDHCCVYFDHRVPTFIVFILIFLRLRPR